MEQLNRYLKTVAKGLPEAQREDIIRELSEDIQSEIDEKESELGRPLIEAEQLALLKLRGNPLLLAARYRQDHRALAFGKQLIGPVLFPFYVKVLSFNLGLTFTVIATIFIALGLSGQRASFNDILSTCLLQLFIQLSVVTLIFTMIERNLTKNPDRWDLNRMGGGLRFDLKMETKVSLEIEPKPRISRLESVSIIIASTVALVWLTGLRSYPFLILGPAALFLKLAPIWYHVYFPIIALIAAEIVRAVINLVRPDWVLFRQIYGLFVHAGGLLVVYYLIRGGTWVMAEQAGEYTRAVEVINQVIYYVLMVTAAWSAVMLVTRIVRMLRGPRNRTGSQKVEAAAEQRRS
jgi:hypothetical protein